MSRRIFLEFHGITTAFTGTARTVPPVTQALCFNEMKIIRKEASFEDRANRLEEVRQLYIAFRQEVERDFTLTTDDCRLSFLKNTISLTRGTVILNLAFHRCGIDNDFGMRFFGLTDLSSLGPQVRNMSKFTRLSWCVMFQFQLESLLRNILKELGVTVPRGYYKVVEKTVDRLSLSNRQHTIRKLNIIANIRNSLHNIGRKRIDEQGISYHERRYCRRKFGTGWSSG